MIQSNFDNDHLDHQGTLDYRAAFLIEIFSQHIRITGSVHNRFRSEIYLSK